MNQQLSLDQPREMRELVLMLRKGEADWQATADFLERVIKWSFKEAPINFDETFIHSVYIQFHDRKRLRGLTPPQINAMINIVKRFNIT